MKILHAIPGISRKSGGPSRSSQGLVAALCKQGVDAWIYPIDGTEPWLAGVRKYTQTLSTQTLKHFDLVHIHGIWDLGLHKIAVMCRKAGVPYVIAPRGMLEPWSLKQKWLKKRIARWLYQDKDLRCAAALHATAENEAYDVPEACIKLLSKHPDLQVEILGGGPEKDRLRALMQERGFSDNIHVRGFVAEDELNDYFSRADVFVSPLHDTIQDRARCPSKIFYYIPYNKPIVTCALGDPLETLGASGFYYKPDDIDDMSRAIDKALAASGGFSYPAGFIEKHSWEARARRFEKWLGE